MRSKRLFFLPILLFISITTFAQKRDLNIVFIGNSITYGAGLPDRTTQAPPAVCVSYLKMQKKIGEVNFSNQGHSGYTTLDWLPGTRALNAAEDAARAFANKPAQMIFSIKIGTNDSAIKGTHGAPVAVADYRVNLKSIIDQLLKDFPGCLVMVQHPIWYSPNTYNGTAYLQEGLTRLETYIPVIDELVKSYSKTHKKQVFVGDKDGWDYFKKHAETDFQHEQGQQGIFYLHPNVQGSAALGEFWGKAIAKVVK